MARSYNIPLVLSTADRLEDEQVRCYIGTTLEKEQFYAFVELLRARLPEDVPVRTLRGSLEYLAGLELTAEELGTLCWRLAGNVNQLRARRLVPPWTHQEADEWVPLQIIQVDPGRDRWDHPGAFINLRVLAGSPCPRTLQTFWTRKFINLLASHFGFSKPWGEYPFEDPVAITESTAIS